jgi:hypothetical protein
MLPGDADIMIGGERRRLRLTLGALAHMENAIGDGDAARMFERLKNPGAADLLNLLHALLLGGGADLTLDMLKRADVDIEEAGRAIGKALAALAASREETLNADGDSPGKLPPRRKPFIAGFPSGDGYATR